jgi:preprotein translocase subunit SecE
MGKVTETIDGAKTFIGEVQAELKKSSWPPRSELIESSVVIIVSVLILGLFVGLCDQAINLVLDFLLKKGS